MVGFWWGMFRIASEAVGVLLLGDAGEWREKLVSVPLGVAAFFVGGVLYTLFLPASVRSGSAPAGWARTRTGALAGFVTALPLAIAGLIHFGGRDGGPVIALLLPSIFALVGAACGCAASLEARFGSRYGGWAGAGGAGPAPRPVEPR